MNRYRSNYPLDDVPEPIGDGGFNRLDMRTDAATLPEGAVQRCENFRFDTQGARVRAGIARQLNPGDVLSDILFASIYRPDSSNDRIALVTTNTLHLFNPADQSVATYNFPAGETITPGEAVDFIQAGISSGTIPDAYILRGLAKTALKFDGVSLAVAATFQKSDFGLFFQDRIAVKSKAQALSVSDFLDFTTWATLNQFQILKGSDDYLQGFLSWQRDYLIIGTRKRFFIAYLAPSIGTSGSSGSVNPRDSFLHDLTREGGLLGRRAWMEAGGLIWIVSDNGIYAFQPQLDLELTVLGQPLSAAIQPIMDRLSANYASGACIGRSGFRLYFALPISGEKISLTAVSVNETPPPNEATFTTADPHGLTVGDLVQLANVVTTSLNGVQTVTAVANSTTFKIQTTATSSAELGERATCQYVAQRNNRIAVWNLELKAWESVDTLPAGLFADFLVTADRGARRALWIVDKMSGPAVFEEGDVDEVGAALGCLTLPFILPMQLSRANYTAAPIIGRITTRAYRWGMFPRLVRAGEVRLTTRAGDAGTIEYTVNTPDREPWTSTRTFDDTNPDTCARKRCGKRGLEGVLDIITSAGRPTVRSVAMEITNAGRVAEE